jgi:hypothetical protein
MEPFVPTERTRLHRLPDRAAYDRETVYSILDEALFCHVAYVEAGHPKVIPTIHVRVGDTLYIHGSTASHTLRTLKNNQETCVAVTLIDGLVLARSGFHHSMNYRSVMVYGTAREVTDPEEKFTAQAALVDHVVPDRSKVARLPSESELKQTTILAISLEEVSAKIRTGPPKEDEGDYELSIWAGVLPLRFEPGEPIDDPRLAPGLDPPDSVTNYRRPSR